MSRAFAAVETLLDLRLARSAEDAPPTGALATVMRILSGVIPFFAQVSWHASFLLFATVRHLGRDTVAQDRQRNSMPDTAGLAQGYSSCFVSRRSWVRSPRPAPDNIYFSHCARWRGVQVFSMVQRRAMLSPRRSRPQLMEGWQSGRMHRLGKAAGLHGPREFESRTLRQNSRSAPATRLLGRSLPEPRLPRWQVDTSLRGFEIRGA